MLEAAALDAVDPLAFARERFRLPADIVYLDGNSLGALPAATPSALSRTAEQQWGEDLVASWNKHGWIEWPILIAAKLAPIVGAKPCELLIADSTSVCLFKLLSAALRARAGRGTIITSFGNFPTDVYVAQGLAGLLGVDLKAVPAEEVIDTIDSDTAAVCLSHVNYRSGAILDMPLVNQSAKAAGALAIWDLSHSAGALALDLEGSGCELAVGCGYKYLNGGPGAPAFIYVAKRLQDELQPSLQGWMGHAEPFAFEHGYRAGQGMARFLTGTPPVLGLAALDAGLETFSGISMGLVAEKSRKLSQLFIAEVESLCGDRVRLASPREPTRRGSHVTFSHMAAYPVMQALISGGVIGDFRAPDLLRFGFAPLYNNYSEVARAAAILGRILKSGEWDRPRFHKRLKVT